MAYSHSIAVVADQKAQGTNGDAIATTAETTLTLNTIVTDPDNIVQSVSGNQFTLGAGDYEVIFGVVGHDAKERRTTLYNATDATVVGTVQNKADFYFGATSIGTIRFSIGGTKSFEVFTQNNRANAKMGYPWTLGTEQYTTVIIRKIVDSSIPFSVCTIAEQYGIGVGGGAFNSGARRTRNVNTKLQDLDGIATLNGDGSFDLDAGRYEIIASCNCLYDVGRVRMWLHNIDTASDLCQGINASIEVAVNETSASFLLGTFDLSVTTTLELQMRCAASNADGFGFAATFDVGNFLYITLRKYSE